MPILIELLQAETKRFLDIGQDTLDTLFRRKRETKRTEEKDLSKEERSEETDQIVAQIGNEVDGKHRF